MDEKYALITTTTLALLAVRFRLNLNKPGVLNNITGEALIEILNILEQSMYETEQQIHELYEILNIVGKSIGQTIKDVLDKFNEEKIEGDRKDA